MNGHDVRKLYPLWHEESERAVSQLEHEQIQDTLKIIGAFLDTLNSIANSLQEINSRQKYGGEPG